MTTHIFFWFFFLAVCGALIHGVVKGTAEQKIHSLAALCAGFLVAIAATVVQSYWIGSNL